MRIKVVVLLTSLLFGTYCFAQNPVTSETTQHFSLSGSATGFIGGASGSQPATIAGAWLNITQRVSIGYEMITVPTFATFKFGMAQYQLPLSSLVGKKLTGHFLFDASKVAVGFQGGVGNLTQNNQNVSRFAGTAGVTLSYPINTNVSMQILSAQWVRGSTVNGLVTSPSAAAISTGLGINF